MASIFTVTEEDLFNFEKFCDSKYTDANVQKHGFFKIKLDSGLDGQCSTMIEFFKQFSLQCHAKLRKSFLLKNPNSSHLFGHQNVLPNSEDKDYFMSSEEQLIKMDSNNVPLNCCMKALEHSEDDFLEHFFTKVTSNPKVLDKNIHDELSQIRRRASTKLVAYEKRQSYEKATTMEGKMRSLTMAMLSEEIVESPSQCLCDSCNTSYSFKNATRSCSDKEEEDDVILYSAGIDESRNNYLHLTNNFAMAHLCFKNMLSSVDSVFNGVSYPALYLGGLHSVFPLHTEDLSCWSFNFLLHGLPKFWLMVPPTEVSRLTDALQRRGFYGLHRWCRNTLNHKFYVPTPEFFREENIPFELVIQQRGEGIVVLPNTAHTGGNLGPNLAQACNFGSHKWIPYGCVSSNCPCMKDAVHADLSDLVAVHQPSLLKAYILNDIVNVVEDQYFQRSILVPKKDSSCGSVPTPPTNNVDYSSARRKSQGKMSRVKCPVCAVSWAYVQKSNMVTHIVKHHNPRIGEKILTDFIEQYSLSIK